MTDVLTSYATTVTSAITKALVAAGEGQPVVIPQTGRESVDSVASGA
ncbi:hypothetical protein ACFXBB_13845 [Streptomyces scopuliridis]